MLRDHRRLLVTFADKAAVRDYVDSVLGPGHLPIAYAVLDSAAELSDLALPPTYVVKPTHGSGAVIVVSEQAPEEARLPEVSGGWSYAHVRPAAADRHRMVELATFWLAQLYGQGPNREWAYGQIPRRILVEERLIGPDGQIPDDYKLFVFNQRCRFIQLDTGRFGGRTQDFYLPTWEHLDMSGGLPWATEPQARPERLDEMIDMAERLARDTDFVRVDLYHLADRVVFGELTSYPAGGNSPFEPEHFNAEFGRHWRVPGRYVDR